MTLPPAGQCVRAGSGYHKRAKVAPAAIRRAPPTHHAMGSDRSRQEPSWFAPVTAA